MNHILLWAFGLIRFQKRLQPPFLFAVGRNAGNGPARQRRLPVCIRCRYDLTLHLLDYYKENVEHILLFQDADNLRTNMNFNFAGHCDWIYNEFLAVDDKRLSFEVVLFSDSFLYCEFSRLRYKKIRTSPAQGRA